MSGSTENHDHDDDDAGRRLRGTHEDHGEDEPGLEGEERSLLTAATVPGSIGAPESLND